MLLSNQSEASIKEIIFSSENLLDMTNQIASASEQQNITNKNVSENIVNIIESFDNSSTMLSEILIYTEKLKDTSRKLNTQYSSFKLK